MNGNKKFFFRYDFFDQLRVLIEPIFDILPQARDTKMGGVIQRYILTFFGRLKTFSRYYFWFRALIKNSLQQNLELIKMIMFEYKKKIVTTVVFEKACLQFFCKMTA